MAINLESVTNILLLLSQSSTYCIFRAELHVNCLTHIQVWDVKDETMKSGIDII